MNATGKTAGFSSGISIILPALNEEDNLSDLVNEIIDYFKHGQMQFEIIIVNDGSTDKTGQIADQLSMTHHNISVIHHPENKGYGNSLRDGFQAGKYEYLFYTDTDRQFRINSLDNFFPFIKDGKMDMVIGYRIDRQDIFLRKFLAWCFNKVVSKLFSLHVKDIDCAFKLFKRESFVSLDLTANDFSIDTEILAKAQMKKFRFVQVGVKHYPRSSGNSTVSYKSLLLAIKRLFALYQEIRIYKKQDFYQ